MSRNKQGRGLGRTVIIYDDFMLLRVLEDIRKVLRAAKSLVPMLVIFGSYAVAQERRR